jgi:hypothetical protein
MVTTGIRAPGPIRIHLAHNFSPAPRIASWWRHRPRRRICQAGPVPATPAPSPADPATPAQKPPSVRVAIGLLAALAALLLLYAALTFFGRDGVRQALTTAGLTRAEAEQFLLVNVTSSLVLGVTYAVSAVAVERGRAWGRWTGLLAATVLVLLMLTTMLSAGGVSVVSLLQLVLSASAAASLLARTTREWLAPTGG